MRPHLTQMETIAPRRADAERAKLHKEADRRWTKLGREHPELADTIAFGRGLVTRYIDDLPAAGALTLAPAAAREKLAAGLPLLEDEDLDLDLRGVRHFFFRLCSWAGTQQELAPGADRLQRGMVSGELNVDDLIAAALAGEGEVLEATATRFDVPPALIQTLTGFTVSAALMETARALLPLVEGSGVEWDEPVCPVCGGPPLLSELQGSEGARTLRCAVCGSGWRFARTRCAHCGIADQKQLRYIAAEREGEKYRVDLCDNCHGFLKSVTSFAPTPAELLTIEDAAMLHLDAEARERGYTALPGLDDEEADGAAAMTPPGA